MEFKSKKYVHDHVSSYKNRGEKFGCSNRFVRAHRSNEDRKVARLDELSKRRDLLLSLGDSSVEESPSQKKATIKSKDKGKSNDKENKPKPQSTDERRVMLLKWKEQKELKRKADACKRPQRAVFAVRHVENDKKSVLAPSYFPTKATKTPLSKKNITTSISSDKRVTRSSTRLASNPNAIKPEAKGKTASKRKNSTTAKRPAMSKKVDEEVPKRVTRQSTKATENKEMDDNEKNQFIGGDVVGKSEAVEIPNKATPITEKKQHRIPQKIHFSPPSGINSFQYYSNNFKFKPMSPFSTESFLKGATPVKPTEDVESQNGQNGGEGSKDFECKDTHLSSKYFRDLILTETKRLNSFCEKWEEETKSENDIPEHAKGNIRTAVGQAQLLISQRFKQFSGLIDLSEDETAEKKATMSDLQGFWDMIYFQVEDVHSKMENLEKLKDNNWVEVTKKVKTASKKAKKNTTAKNFGTKVTKPATKSRIKEMKAAMRAKLASEKMQGEQGMSRSFITVLTPVKKIKTPAGCVVLTPVRRSLRNTPIRRQSGSPRTTPIVISTPKRFGNKSPGLRLTPEPLTPDSSASGKLTNTDNGQESQEEMKVESLSFVSEVQTSDDLLTKESNYTIDSTKENMKSKAQNASPKKRSCLRSSTKKNRKLSSVFFQSPKSSAKCTTGDTPVPLPLTPGLQGNERSSFTPLAVTFNSTIVEGSTCSLNAGYTPGIVGSRKSSLRKRASKGTPVRQSNRKHPQATPEEREITCDSALETLDVHDGTTLRCRHKELTGASDSKRRSLRQSCAKGTENEKDCLLPDKSILPSNNESATSPILAGNCSSDDVSQILVAFTPVKGLTNRLNQDSSLTPATMLQALRLEDSPDPSVDSTRRDSVFFAPCAGSLLDNSQPLKQNLMSFSPLAD